MRIPGYCTGCHRIKTVQVSGHQLSVGLARGGNVYEGICSSCEEAANPALQRPNTKTTKGNEMTALQIHDYSRVEAPPDGVQMWTTDQLREEFEVEAFAAPLVFVTRKSDGVKGTVEFTHSPRVYFDFQESDG